MQGETGRAKIDLDIELRTKDESSCMNPREIARTLVSHALAIGSVYKRVESGDRSKERDLREKPWTK